MLVDNLQCTLISNLKWQKSYVENCTAFYSFAKCFLQWLWGGKGGSSYVVVLYGCMEMPQYVLSIAVSMGGQVREISKPRIINTKRKIMKLI